MFLLAENPLLFQHYDPAGLVLYTLFAGILVGIIIPLIRIRAAFLSGAVNMFQIGLRSLRRTVIAVFLSALAGYACLALITPPGTRVALPGTAFLLLPTAIAAVMICWVFVGTHIQAYVRTGGILVSVCTGTIVTAVLFAVAMTVFFPGDIVRESFLVYLLLGVLAALFFFAVRDLYAVIVIVSLGLAVIMGPAIDASYLQISQPVGYLCGLFTLAVLIGTHVYFSLHYTTISLEELRKSSP